MSSDDDSDENEKSNAENGAPPPSNSVGYCNPPLKSRWPKGTSGNPKGRPKREERSWSTRQIDKDIMEELNREVSVNYNGKKVRLPAIVLGLRQLTAVVARGSVSATKLALELYLGAADRRSLRDQKFHDLLEYTEQGAVENPSGQLADAFKYFLEIKRKESRER